MAFEVRGWNELGIVGTIYEEEYEADSILSSSSSSTVPSLDFTPSPTTNWKSGRTSDPDVLIHVQDSCFSLHKEALMARSAYFRRKLAEIPEITLSPPLNITPQIFTLVKDFCYGAHVVVTPSNVAALTTAAELLGMTDTNGPGDRNLRQITEEYFRCEVAVNEEYMCTVLRLCFSLLPEAETAAYLVSRCIEALSLTAGDDGFLGCFDGVKGLGADDFQIVLESVSLRLTGRHDLLYRIIDIYLKENIETLSDDQKIQMCNYIDCSVLSPAILMHAVQNPKMPLRFVVQAMFLQQLNTRHNIIFAANDHLVSKRHDEHDNPKDPITLGAILQRDAALRQVSQLTAVMNATNSRIQTLERELNDMRKLMDGPEGIRVRSEPARSASFRLSSEGSAKIERGQRGSVSALSIRNVKSEVTSSSDESSSDGGPKVEKSFGRRLVSGLKSAFGLQKRRREGKGDVGKCVGNLEGGDNGEGNIVIIKKDQAFHKRSSSQS